jgi:phenylacetate-CoA ligase
MGIFRILNLKRRFCKISRMNKDEVETIQKENINKTVKHAIKKSPFYKEHYKDVPFSNQSTFEHFSSLPLVNKKTIMDNLDQVFTSSTLNRKILEKHLATTQPGKRYLNNTIIHSSGSSGTVGIYAYDSQSWDTLKALVLARCTNFGISLKKKRLAFIGVKDGHYAGVTLASDVPRIMAHYTDVSVNEPISKTVEHLNKFQPDDLRGYPSGLSILVSEQQAGRLNIRPRKIVSSAEPLDEKLTKLIEEVFGVSPYNFYAASESIGLAQDCHLHCGLHVFNDLHAVELLNDKGERVEPGKSGQIVLTNLYNRCQPLIRYQMHDIAVYSEEECDCGLPFPLLKNVYGRQEETIWIQKENGGFDVINPLVFVEFFVPGLRKLQVHYEKLNKIRLLVVAQGNSDKISEAVEKRINTILRGKNLQEVVDMQVEMVDKILPDKKTGKTKTVISHFKVPVI